jgi:thiol-disulfide isomerase/thioredoxin
MRSRILLATAVSACLAWGLPARADDKADKEKAGEIAWAKTFAAAVDQAKKDNKLVMVDFYTDWCGWCKKLDKDTYTDPTVIKLSRQLVAVKLDAEDKSEGQEQAQKYKVHGYPTILFIDPAEANTKAGGVVGKIGGYEPPEKFAEDMRSINQGFKDFPKLRDRVQQSPDDIEAVGRLIVLLHQRGQEQEAADLLERAQKSDPDNTKGCLTRAYNAVADYYQERQEFDKAIPLFRKAAETSKDPTDAAYGRMSIAACHLAQGQVDKAIDALEATLKIPNLSRGDKDQAEDMLKQLKARPKKDDDKDK